MKLALCIPGRDVAHWDSWSSILGMTLNGLGYLQHKYGDLAYIEFHSTSRATVCEARNQLLKGALDQGADWLLWVDDDAVPPSDLVEKLFETKKDLVAPAFFKRNGEPVVHELHGDHDTTPIDPWPPRLFMADVTGFHTVLMRRHVALDVIKEAQPGPAFHEERGDGWKFGEDYWFFRAAKRAGHQLWIDSRITVGHMASRPIGMDDYKEIRKRLRREVQHA